MYLMEEEGTVVYFEVSEPLGPLGLKNIYWFVQGSPGALQTEGNEELIVEDGFSEQTPLDAQHGEAGLAHCCLGANVSHSEVHIVCRDTLHEML